MRNRTVVAILGIYLAIATVGQAQQPRVMNAQLTSRSASADLARTIQGLVSGRTAPAWIGYAVSMIPGEHKMCCYGSWEDANACCGRCRLEANGSIDPLSSKAERVQLESSRTLTVLLRAESGTIQKIRTFNEECEIDAGGLPLYWLTDVKAAESISFLTRFATAAEGDGRGRNLADAAVFAIAFHNDPAADKELARFVAPDQSDSLRERASFWLGSARGRRGFEILARLVREDANERVRNAAVFALTQSKEPEALTTIIQVAKDDRSARVRGQALFWLAQKAGRKAAEAITEAIENDPETEVKNRAVFALTQLPRDRGVPQLIEVAKTNRNPAVRKQAMFWLGQSKDPRALAFFEGILK